MSFPMWSANKGVDGAFYIVLRAPNGFQMSPFWGPFDTEPEAKEVCNVRNTFAEKRHLRALKAAAP